MVTHPHNTSHTWAAPTSSAKFQASHASPMAAAVDKLSRNSLIIGHLSSHIYAQLGHIVSQLWMGTPPAVRLNRDPPSHHHGSILARRHHSAPIDSVLSPSFIDLLVVEVLHDSHLTIGTESCHCDYERDIPVLPPERPPWPHPVTKWILVHAHREKGSNVGSFVSRVFSF
jgi:hypothetical protein